MKLVVGLGNPGRKYAQTRHNVGYKVLAEVARLHATGRPKSKFQGELVEAELGGHRAVLLSPITYMNRSGSSVRAACDFYKLPLEELLVVCDDLNLPLAKLRVRTKGSAGGQKGLLDIIEKLATDQFARLRVGIGASPDGWDAADYVLGRFSVEEEAEIRHAVLRAADAVLDWACSGVQECMNRYN
jgi:PTH1 family peptidyl-tRNA hydrolase